MGMVSYLYLKEVYIDYGFRFANIHKYFPIDHSLYLNGSLLPIILSNIFMKKKKPSKEMMQMV